MKESVYWFGCTSARTPRRLSGTVQADVAVVGGGAAGLACAQHLSAAGARVALVERDVCGAGASGRSSGFITPASEIDLASLVAARGPSEARRLWEFAVSGVELLRANVLELGLDCDYQVQDCLYVARRGLRAHTVREEHDARTRLGYEGCLFLGPRVAEVLGTPRFTSALRFGDTFSIDPHAYCSGLASALEARGVQIFEQSRVTRLRADGVDTPDGALMAGRVVVCADRFIPELGALCGAIYHVQTFLAISAPLATHALRRLFPTGPVMVWDSDLIYSYFRLADAGRLLLGGGDLLHTYAARPPDTLEPFARRARRSIERTFGDLELEIECAWSGMLGVSKDLLPIHAPDRERESIWYVGAATGLPWASALGRYAAERIVAGRRDFDGAFSPQRDFAVGPRLQALLSTPVTFALCNAVARFR